MRSILVLAAFVVGLIAAIEVEVARPVFLFAVGVSWLTTAYRDRRHVVRHERPVGYKR